MQLNKAAFFIEASNSVTLQDQDAIQNWYRKHFW